MRSLRPPFRRAQRESTRQHGRRITRWRPAGRQTRCQRFSYGQQQKGLQPLYDILENSDVPIGKLLPTHVNRSESLFEQALAFALKGGVIDITTSIPDPVAPAEGIARAVKAGVPLSRVTLSSDGNGSQPLFDAAGNLTGIGVAGFESLLETLQTLVNHYGFSLTDALRPLTTSVAAFLSLDGKGEIRPGNDADLLVFSADLRIEQVYARGKRMVNEGKACVKGTFEPA